MVRQTAAMNATSIDGTERSFTSGGVRVRELPQMLGDDVLAVVVDAGDETTRIRSLGLLYDYAERSDLVLMVGVAPDRLPTCLTEVTERGARAVVVDPVPTDAIAQVRAVAADGGLTVFERRVDVPWLVISDFIRNLMQRSEADAIRTSGITGEDLFGLAESLAESLGGPVIIEDAKFRVLSYSSSTAQVDRGRDMAILGRRIPDDWLRHLESLGVIDTLLGTDEVVVVHNGPLAARRRLLCSIRAERFLLGILWVAEGDTPLPVDISDRMKEAARTAAPYLLRQQEASFGKRSAQDRQLRQLLDEGTIPHSAAEEFGLLPATHYSILALRISPDAQLSNLDRNRVVDLVGMYCQSYRWRAATTAVGHTVYCVLAHDNHTPQTGGTKDFAAGLGGHVSRALPGRGVHIALSRRADWLHDIPRIRQQADNVLETASPTTTVTVRSFDEALPEIMLSRLAHVIRSEGFEYPKLTRLRLEDTTSGSEYINSLRAFLLSFGDTAAAAKQLNIHVTTMRYRLRRIAELSGLDLADPAERLICELLLRT